MAAGTPRPLLQLASGPSVASVLRCETITSLHPSSTCKTLEARLLGHRRAGPFVDSNPIPKAQSQNKRVYADNLVQVVVTGFGEIDDQAIDQVLYQGIVRMGVREIVEVMGGF